MENASKALLIAGGVLIALLLLGLVVYTFREWGDAQEMQQLEVNAQVVYDFNKSYLSYEKTLYGSELLGLVNKMLDYNRSADVIYDGYTTMSMEVYIKGTADDLFTSEKYYNLQEISGKLEDVEDETVDNSQFSKILPSYWERLAKSSSLSSAEFDNLCTQLEIDSSINRNNLQNAAKEYYKYVQFKRLKFSHENTTFSDSGRVESMEFRQK